MARRIAAWGVTVPLAIGGTQLAHALAYRLATPEAHERAHELSASGHGYLAYLPLAMAVATVLVLLALVVEIRHVVASPRTPGLPVGAWRFALVAPGIFACQEHFERLVQDGAFPWSAALAPTFLLGLLLQAPFALVAYAFARVLLRVARSIGQRLAQPWLGGEPATLPLPASPPAFPRVRALALGYGPRGPPLLLAA